MLAAVYAGRDELNLEDGSFELSKKASPQLLENISTGEKADVRAYYIGKGYPQEQVDKVIDESLDEGDFFPVPVKTYEHFYRDVPEDFDNDGEEDASIRVFKSDSEVDMASFNEGAIFQRHLTCFLSALPTGIPSTWNDFLCSTLHIHRAASFTPWK